MKRNYSVLIVDDDITFHKDLRETLGNSFEFHGAKDIAHMRQKLAENQHYDLILLDLVLDDTGERIGLKLISEISAVRKGIPIIAMTAYGSDADTVVEAMNKGAKSFVDKNKVDYGQWKEKMHDAIATVQVHVYEEKIEILERKVDQLSGQHQFIGESSKIQEIKKLLEAVADMPQVTVLITGETGVGKEVAARYLHKHSPRAGNSFVGVNLSAIPTGLIESYLFGHVKGAFTDARMDKEGHFREANGGVLLLDEIGDINAEIQTKLLRVIEERMIRPVGKDKDVPVDVHLLTATHRNLDEEVAAGRFRLDLYQRLKSFIIEIPSLRERREDIPLLLEHFLSQQLPGVSIEKAFSREAFDKLMAYDWVGNIRELRGAVDHAIVRKKVYKTDIVTIECLPVEIQQFDPYKPRTGIKQQSQNAYNIAIPIFKNRKEEQSYRDLVKIEDALKQAHGNKTEAAQILGYPGSDNLRSRIKICYRNFPNLFESFPLIREAYDTIVGE
ncbi:MAG TPA: sigma-54 dependent transcriptional regulator [Cyclobacteriaceae bacterium]|nr:sigma-54 dependent transcriptional regulator [Cyclobacteriaceae bacterium]